MSNYGDTPDNSPQDPYGQDPHGQDPYGQTPQSPGGGANYGQPPSGPYGQSGGAPGGVAQFSVGAAFAYGWKKFVANVGPILIAAVVMVVAVVAIQLLQRSLADGSRIVSLVFSIVLFLAQLVIQSAIVKGSLDITRGTPITVGSLVEGINWAQVIVASLIIAVAMSVGFVLLILPGLAVLFLTSFTTYFIIDKNMGAIDAIKASVSFVAANFGALLVFFLATIAAYIVGALLCGVGLLVAVPVVVIASAYAYRTLQGEPVAA